jgi:hypothetical protein
MFYLVVFLLIVAYKIISNLYFLRKTIFYAEKYHLYITTNPNDLYINNNKKFIKELFSKAGHDNESFHQMVPMGFGKGYTGTYTLFDNMGLKNEYIVNRLNLIFPETETIFKTRILESFNPIYWIELLIYLPRNIFSYIGLGSESVYTKILQVFYWALSGIGTILLNEYFKLWLPFK